ncbi:hypothetical protein T484DRAFT_1934425 [Baffinella frigidus]|nr:hypothetical protein T484DRAFT_1934425 [Cryptophyta sp. CCMP2293]
MADERRNRRCVGEELGMGSAKALIVVVALASLSGASALKCMTNNGNDVSVLPTNTSVSIECAPRHQCGSLFFSSPPVYFNQDCGADKKEVCSCMMLCVPLWVGEGKGSWKDPIRPTVFFGESYTKVCDSDNCNTVCAASSAHTLIASLLLPLLLAFSSFSLASR